MTAAFRPTGELMIHLLNNPVPLLPWQVTDRDRYDDLQATFHAPFEVNPIHEVRIRFGGLNPLSAHLPLQNADLPLSGAPATLTVPRVDLHEVVLVELEGHLK
jgi:hypothetical protein